MRWAKKVEDVILCCYDLVFRGLIRIGYRYKIYLRGSTNMDLYFELEKCVLRKINLRNI